MINKDLFVTKKTTSVFLQKYIAYYYFHECVDEQFQNQYVYYPHYKNALSIYNKSDFKFNSNQYSISPNASKDFFFAYEGIPTTFRTVHQQAPFNKVGIVFQPLGINHFLKDNLAVIKGKTNKVEMDYFRISMNACLKKIYNTKDIAVKVNLLDAYFNSQFVGFEEDRLMNAVDLLLNTDEKYTVNVLAEQLEMNRKTLLRLFQKHLCCSVKDYINVVLFRKALLTYQFAQKKPLLTNLAYDTGYYDQSEFINHFKKITGFNPTKILGNIQKLGNEDTFWTVP